MTWTSRQFLTRKKIELTLEETWRSLVLPLLYSMDFSVWNWSFLEDVFSHTWPSMKTRANIFSFLLPVSWIAKILFLTQHSDTHCKFCAKNFRQFLLQHTNVQLYHMLTLPNSMHAYVRQCVSLSQQCYDSLPVYFEDRNRYQTDNLKPWSWTLKIK